MRAAWIIENQCKKAYEVFMIEIVPHPEARDLM